MYTPVHEHFEAFCNEVFASTAVFRGAHNQNKLVTIGYITRSLYLYLLETPSFRDSIVKIMQIFRIAFHNNDKVYQLHAKHVEPAELYGFIEVCDLLFDEHTSIVIDPAEEKLKMEFKGVSRLYLPMHAIIRIDEMTQQGKNKILDKDGKASNITPFPLSGPGPKSS